MSEEAAMPLDGGLYSVSLLRQYRLVTSRYRSH